MSGKFFRTALKITAIVAAVALAIPTGGGSLLAVGLGVSALTATAIVVGLNVASTLLSKRPQAPTTSSANKDRLLASIDPRTPRKIIFGHTAMATDIRDQEYTGDQTYLHRFIVVASHKVQAIDEIWFDDKQAWTAVGGVTADFTGYLTVAAILEGGAGNAINISARMGTTRRYTGCAYVHLRYKLTGATNNAESPFARAIPTRITIRGHGAVSYEPRLDSTVPGGSGAHRADDQATWAWGDTTSRNPAIQLLWYLLGWRINGELAVGKGIPKERIDIPSFISAANLCDESVALALGGTEPRYRTDGIFSEGDDPKLVCDNLCASMNAVLDDVDGKLRLTVLHNDLSTPAVDLTADDILGEFNWDQTASLDESFNVVRGTYTDPSDASLYQAVDYPQVEISSPDGIDRIEAVDLPLVQSPSQAQRLAKQRIARMLYSGTFSATFSHRAWKAQKGSIVRLTFAPLGWTLKLFRVVDTATQVDGQVPMVLREENADIYAWDAEDAPALEAADPTTYDPLLDPLYLDIVDGGIYIFHQDEAPTAAESSFGDEWLDTDDGNRRYYRIAGSGYLEDENGDPITFGDDDELIDIAWVTATDQNILNAIASFEGIGDDGMISIGEKIEILIPKSAELEGQWAVLDSQASLYDVPTEHAAASDARDAWIAFRDALSPAWNDTNAATPVDRVGYNAISLAFVNSLSALNAAIVDKAGVSAPRHEPASLTVTIEADHTGAVLTGQLPKTIVANRILVDTDVSATATWTTEDIGAGLTVSNTDNAFTVTAFDGQTKTFIARSVRNDLTINSLITLQKNLAPPPASGSGSGTSVSESALGGLTDTSYTAITPVMTVHTGATPRIDFSAPLQFQTAEQGPEGDYHVSAVWRWRAVAGSFADVGTDTAADYPARVTNWGTFYTVEPGAITVTAAQTAGLTANTDYEVQLYAVLSIYGPAQDVYFSGTATATGS